jgi:SMODS-associating 2TM, beta-strand rich effector domain
MGQDRGCLSVPNSAWTRGIILVAAAISGALALLQGGKIDSALLRAVFPASSAVIFLLFIFDRWAWRWPLVGGLVTRPNLHGTWKCELRSSYEARAGEVIESYLVIDQTYTRICVRMLFDRSQSISMSGDLVDEGGRCVLYYVFRSEKSALEPDSNPPARGAADLKVSRKPRVALEGDYWMERGTKGTLATVGRSKTLYDAFPAAQRDAFDE